MPQSAKDRREMKKTAEKKRRERIKANPELHNAIKAKARDRYYRRKANGDILPASEMTLQQKRVKQLRDRLTSKLYRERKKQLPHRDLKEELVFCEDNPPIANDPLSSLLVPREPPRRRSSQRLSKQLKSTVTSTPQPDPSTRSVDTSKSSNILPSCSKRTTNNDFTNIARTSVPLPRKKLYPDDNFSTISQSTKSDLSSLSSVDYLPTVSPRSQKRSRADDAKDAFDKKLMRRRIEELKSLNSKYRKELLTLKKNILEIRKLKNLKITLIRQITTKK